MTGVGYSGGVVVAAVGARTPVGLSADASVAAWRAGVSRLGFHHRFVDKAGEPVRVATDGALDPDMPVSQRMLEMATSAVHEACESLVGAGRPAVSLMVGLPQARPGLAERDAAPLLQHLVAAAGHYVQVQHATLYPRGHAAGLLALQNAAREIESGTVQACLIGGVDSWLDSRAIAWLDDTRRLASEANRGGLSPGEAAAFVLVTSATTARALRLPVLARIRGVAAAQEPKALGTDSVCVGEGLAQAIASASGGLRLPEEKITTTYCDINGERYRSEEFMYLPLRVWAPFVDANRYATAADAWGDVGAATGPLLLSIAAVSARRGWAPGKYVLVWAGSDGGARAAATLALEVAAA